ncbi:phosphotransferase [Yinghuangia aomiensis]
MSAQVGGREFTAEDLPEGGGSGVVALVTLADGHKVFVKATDAPGRMIELQLEADLGPYLPEYAPRFLWSVTAAGWYVIAVEGLSGVVAELEAASPHLGLIAEALTAVGQQKAPVLDPPLWTAWDTWRIWDIPEAEPLFQGDRLVHADPAATNFIITPNRAYLIDWSWSLVGPAWIDPALCAVRLMADGDHTAESAYEWASRIPAFAEAPPGGLRALAVAEARRWVVKQEQGYTDISKVTAASAAWATYLTSRA